MEAARAARGRRRHNLSLRQLAPARSRREKSSTDRAFESFYRKHVAEVYQYALAVLTNPADAEDVTQQTFLNAYRAFQRGERPHTPHNWLIKIAHNVCRMRWRQSSRRPHEVPLDQVREPVAVDEERPSLEDVLRALSRLPFNQRAAIVMREVEGRTYAEIADVLGTTVPAVEALLFRARTNLRARRKALGVLTVAPLPGSLSSFFSGGGGLVAAGGAALGSEFLLKAVAVVATTVVAGGLGFKAVKAVAKPEPASPQLQQRGGHAPASADPAGRIVSPSRGARASARTAFAHPSRSTARGDRVGKTPTNDRPSESGSVAAAPEQTQNGAAASAAPVQDQAATTVNKIVASVPTPPPPATPVPLPTTPTLPSVTVTVTVPTVTIPPPPPLK